MLGKWRLMRNMQKFAVFALALPLCLAMPSVAFANTILTSKTYVDTNTVAVNQGTGPNNANVGKTLVVNSSGNLVLGDKQTAPSSGVATGKVLTYTGDNVNTDVSASYIKVPVTASGAPSSNTVTGIAEIWIQ